MDGEAIVVAISVPLFITAMVIGFFTFIYKSRARKLETLVKIVELGGTVDPDMMKMLGDGGGGYKNDYKTGIIWLAVGIPIFLGILLTGGTNESVFGLIPVFVGIAFLISGKYRLRESS